MDLTPEHQASLDQALVDTRQRKADALADPSHPFHRAPASFWEKQEQAVIGVRVRAGLSPDVAPLSPQQMADEQTAKAFPMPDTIDPNLQEMLDQLVAPLVDDRIAREEATKALKTELGAAEYDRLVKAAAVYKPNLSDAEKTNKRVLNMYEVMGRRNTAKRNGGIWRP
jgi:hypothetical protein